jgi:hypothetical protein
MDFVTARNLIIENNVMSRLVFSSFHAYSEFNEYQCHS